MQSIRAGSADPADPFDATSSQGTSEVDEQLAAEIENQAVRDRYKDLAARLTIHSDATSRAMAKAWEKIQSEMATFEKQKRTIYHTLRKVEGRDRATRVIRMGLDRITPEVYRKIQPLAGGQRPKSPAYISPLTSPRPDDSIFVPQSNALPDLSDLTPNTKRPGPAQSSAQPQHPPPESAGPSNPAPTPKPKFTVRHTPHELCSSPINCCFRAALTEAGKENRRLVPEPNHPREEGKGSAVGSACKEHTHQVRGNSPPAPYDQEGRPHGL